MKRRGFFGALLGLPAAIKAASVEAVPVAEMTAPLKPVEQPIGFDVFWSITATDCGRIITNLDGLTIEDLRR